MIINKDFYRCPKCGEFYTFDTSKSYTAICPKCNCELEFRFNGDCDPERAERVRKGIPAYHYDPTTDPDSPLYIPVITCPTCSSTNVKKISKAARAFSIGTWGLASNKINKSFECKTCGYTW